MPSNYYNWAFSAITNMLNANSGLFVAMGQHLFMSLATIMLAWFGIKSALSAGEYLGGIHFGQFASLVLTISFGFAMITYYSSPIPGFGVDFHHLITDETQYLSNAISLNMIDTLTNRLTAFEAQIEPPGMTLSASIYFNYWIIIILLSTAQAIAMVVAAFGILASAVCVLVGPIFIPFFIVPQLDWLFWGWLKCFIQYAFYQVIAAAVVYIIGNVLIGFIETFGDQKLTATEQATMVPAILIVVVASVYALIKVPMLTSHIFSGSSGGSAAGLMSSLNPIGGGQ